MGLETAALIAGITASAVSAGSSIYSAVSGGASKGSADAATSEISGAADKARKARSQLLETAGGAAGTPLQPGEVKPTNTVFGN